MSGPTGDAAGGDLGVPCHVEHNYAMRTTDTYGGGDHVVLDGPLEYGRLRRDVGDALCRPASTFRDLQPTDDNRDPDCVTCRRQLDRLIVAGVLAAPTGGRRTRSLPCLAWANFHDWERAGQDRTCQRCDRPFDEHLPQARLAGWLATSASRERRGLPPLPLPAFVRAELDAAAADDDHPQHAHPLLGFARGA